MKILMLNYEFPPLGGGGGVVTFHLSKELVKQGHEVDVVTMCYKGLKKEEVIDGIHIYRVSCLRNKREVCCTREMLTYVISALLFTLRLTRSNKYDIAHCHFIIPTGLLAYSLGKIRSLPYIITSHGSDVPGHNPERFSLQHKALLPFWSLIVKNAERIVVPSTYLKDLILRKVTANNISVIHNGQSITPGVSLKKERQILLVSRMLKRKGFQYFLEAITDLDLGGWQINIVGEGPYKAKLMQRSEKLNHKVNFLGFKKGRELEELYRRAAIFVFPSANESFGLVLTEAMDVGCAIITTNVTGCKEVVGEVALLVRPMNSEDIKQALIKLVDDEPLREELGMKARERVKLFSWEKVAEEYAGVYRSVAQVWSGLI